MLLVIILEGGLTTSYISTIVHTIRINHMKCIDFIIFLVHLKETILHISCDGANEMNIFVC